MNNSGYINKIYFLENLSFIAKFNFANFKIYERCRKKTMCLCKTMYLCVLNLCLSTLLTHKNFEIKMPQFNFYF